MANVLVAVDGSRHSMRAIDYAAREAKAGAKTLQLLNVEPPLDDYGMVSAYLTRQQHAKAMKARSAAILKRAAGRAQARNATCKVHMVLGDVPNSIVRTARRLKCESIIMGTRGMGPLKDLLLGSVASKVLHLAHIPVTLVK